MSRYVIVGAGAVGGAIGGRLHQHGRTVVLVARGRHLEALRSDGLLLKDPDREVRLDIPVVGDPSDIDWQPDDVAIVCTKTDHTAAALEQLAEAAPNHLPVVCAQNGLANERIALRQFPNVHAIPVMLPATHDRPGVVAVHSAPTTGVLDVGRIPSGSDEVDAAISADLNAASFSSRPLPEVVPWKRTKLLRNLANAIDAATGDLSSAGARRLRQLAHEEGEACFRAAGMSWVSDTEFVERRRGHMTWRPADTTHQLTTSTRQSLRRDGRGTEVDYLNGEIVLLGRLYGVSAPVNELLQMTVRSMDSDGLEAGGLRADDLLGQLESSS